MVNFGFPYDCSCGRFFVDKRLINMVTEKPRLGVTINVHMYISKLLYFNLQKQ